MKHYKERAIRVREARDVPGYTRRVVANAHYYAVLKGSQRDAEVSRQAW
jgi:hypothetical protein